MFVLQELIHAAVITGLVFVMMASVELAAVLSQNRLSTSMLSRPLRQYLLAALLGATPGCAGGYMAVSLYSRGAISLGAVAAALMATAGDEAFFMLATMPGTAVALFAGLFVVGVLGGWMTDVAVGRLGLTRDEPCALAELHDEDRDGERWLPPRPCLRPAAPRLVLLAVLTLLCVGIAGGALHHHELPGEASAHAEHGRPDLEAKLFLAVVLAGILLVAVAPPHYLEEHLWRHLALHHAPRIFLWTAGTLIAVAFLGRHQDLGELVAGHGLWVLAGACLLGLIPQSGPHLIVVGLFVGGQIPLSVLVANSIVQDGHALLPLLGISPRDAAVAKAANLLVGLAVGGLMLALGW